MLVTEKINFLKELRDGRYSFSPLLVRLCGMKAPLFEIQSRSGFLWLHFHSDNLLQYSGFIAEYEFRQNISQISHKLPAKLGILFLKAYNEHIQLEKR